MLFRSSVLVWLLGDRRFIREDARLFFRGTTLPENAEVDPNAAWQNPDGAYSDSESEPEVDPEEGDYARVVQLINEYLPVKELAGKLIGVGVLKQFGLIENEMMDHFLSVAFEREKAVPAEHTRPRVFRPAPSPVGKRRPRATRL